ncbi:MAG: site-specific DNA-methyltransferase [Methanospirillaceae archaeon]|nr:site-specific DNA-methyltransferase [Methanospirillaceae archaeon]
MEPFITPYLSLYNEDCITGAQRCIPDESVDLIITDPPYGIEGGQLHRHYHRNEGFVVDGYVEIDRSEYLDFSHQWIKEAERILRPGGSAYIVSGYTNLYAILDALRHTSLTEINHIIWKYNFGVYTKTKFVSSHYHILFYTKPGDDRTFHQECRFGTGEKDEWGGSLNYQDREDVWIINREYKPGQVKNKNELPTELLVKMIQYASSEGDLVADLFLGGCSTARVAVGLCRRAIGFEMSEATFAARARNVSEVIPGSLLADCRIPCITKPNNQGKSWTKEERDRLQMRFATLRSQGKKIGEAEKILMEEFGRGRFAIKNAREQSEKSNQQSLYDYDT